MRPRFHEALDQAKTQGDDRAVTTIRLILAAIGDRETAARARGDGEGVNPEAVEAMIRDMIAQRRHINLRHQREGRVEQAEQELAEIIILQRFLPLALSKGETLAETEAVIREIQAKGLRDLGRALRLLEQRHGLQIDLSLTARHLRRRLGS